MPNVHHHLPPPLEAVFPRGYLTDLNEGGEGKAELSAGEATGERGEDHSGVEGKDFCCWVYCCGWGGG